MVLIRREGKKMKAYYGFTITKNDESRDYPWNIYERNGEYICSCSTLKEAKDSIRETIKREKEGYSK